MSGEEPVYDLGYLSLPAEVQAAVENHAAAAHAVSVPVVPDRETDPAGYLLAACEEIEADADRVSLGDPMVRHFDSADDDEWLADLQVALARHWRGIAERHGGGFAYIARGGASGTRCNGCMESWPCPDLLGAVAAARAYLDGTA